MKFKRGCPKAPPATSRPQPQLQQQQQQHQSQQQWSSSPRRPSPDNNLHLIRALQAQAENSTWRLSQVESAVELLQARVEDLPRTTAAVPETGARNSTGSILRTRSDSAGRRRGVLTAACKRLGSKQVVGPNSDEPQVGYLAEHSARSGEGESVVAEIWRPGSDRLQRSHSSKTVAIMEHPTDSPRGLEQKESELAEIRMFVNDDISKEMERFRTELQVEFAELQRMLVAESANETQLLRDRGPSDEANKQLLRRVDDTSQLVLELRQEQQVQNAELGALRTRVFEKEEKAPQLRNLEQDRKDMATMRVRIEALEASASSRDDSQAHARNSAPSNREAGRSCRALCADEDTLGDVITRLERLESTGGGALGSHHLAEFRARLESMEERIGGEGLSEASAAGALPTIDLHELRARLEPLEQARRSGAEVSTEDFDKLRMALARTVRHITSLGEDVVSLRTEQEKATARIKVLGESVACATSSGIQRIEEALSEELQAKRKQLDKVIRIQEGTASPKTAPVTRAAVAVRRPDARNAAPTSSRSTLTNDLTGHGSPSVPSGGTFNRTSSEAGSNSARPAARTPRLQAAPTPGMPLPGSMQGSHSLAERKNGLVSLRSSNSSPQTLSSPGHSQSSSQMSALPGHTVHGASVGVSAHPSVPGWTDVRGV